MGVQTDKPYWIICKVVLKYQYDYKITCSSLSETNDKVPTEDRVNGYEMRYTHTTENENYIYQHYSAYPDLNGFTIVDSLWRDKYKPSRLVKNPRFDYPRIEYELDQSGELKEKILDEYYFYAEIKISPEDNNQYVYKLRRYLLVENDYFYVKIINKNDTNYVTYGQPYEFDLKFEVYDVSECQIIGYRFQDNHQIQLLDYHCYDWPTDLAEFYGYKKENGSFLSNNFLFLNKNKFYCHNFYGSSVAENIENIPYTHVIHLFKEIIFEGYNTHDFIIDLDSSENTIIKFQSNQLNNQQHFLEENRIISKINKLELLNGKVTFYNSSYSILGGIEKLILNNIIVNGKISIQNFQDYYYVPFTYTDQNGEIIYTQSYYSISFFKTNYVNNFELINTEVTINMYSVSDQVANNEKSITVYCNKYNTRIVNLTFDFKNATIEQTIHLKPSDRLYEQIFGKYWIRYDINDNILLDTLKNDSYKLPCYESGVKHTQTIKNEIKCDQYDTFLVFHPKYEGVFSQTRTFSYRPDIQITGNLKGNVNLTNVRNVKTNQTNFLSFTANSDIVGNTDIEGSKCICRDLNVKGGETVELKFDTVKIYNYTSEEASQEFDEYQQVSEDDKKIINGTLKCYTKDLSIVNHNFTKGIQLYNQMENVYFNYCLGIGVIFQKNSFAKNVTIKNSHFKSDLIVQTANLDIDNVYIMDSKDDESSTRNIKVNQKNTATESLTVTAENFCCGTFTLYGKNITTEINNSTINDTLTISNPSLLQISNSICSNINSTNSKMEAVVNVINSTIGDVVLSNVRQYYLQDFVSNKFEILYSKEVMMESCFIGVKNKEKSYINGYLYVKNRKYYDLQFNNTEVNGYVNLSNIQTLNSEFITVNNYFSITNNRDLVLVQQQQQQYALPAVLNYSFKNNTIAQNLQIDNGNNCEKATGNDNVSTLLISDTNALNLTLNEFATVEILNSNFQSIAGVTLRDFTIKDSNIKQSISTDNHLKLSQSKYHIENVMIRNQSQSISGVQYTYGNMNLQGIKGDSLYVDNTNCSYFTFYNFSSVEILNTNGTVLTGNGMGGATDTLKIDTGEWQSISYVNSQLGSIDNYSYSLSIELNQLIVKQNVNLNNTNNLTITTCDVDLNLTTTAETINITNSNFKAWDNTGGQNVNVLNSNFRQTVTMKNRKTTKKILLDSSKETLESKYFSNADLQLEQNEKSLKNVTVQKCIIKHSHQLQTDNTIKYLSYDSNVTDICLNKRDDKYYIADQSINKIKNILKDCDETTITHTCNIEFDILFELESKVNCSIISAGQQCFINGNLKLIAGEQLTVTNYNITNDIIYTNYTNVDINDCKIDGDLEGNLTNVFNFINSSSKNIAIQEVIDGQCLINNSTIDGNVGFNLLNEEQEQSTSILSVLNSNQPTNYHFDFNCFQDVTFNDNSHLGYIKGKNIETFKMNKNLQVYDLSLNNQIELVECIIQNTNFISNSEFLIIKSEQNCQKVKFDKVVCQYNITIQKANDLQLLDSSMVNLNAQSASVNMLNCSTDNITINMISGDSQIANLQNSTINGNIDFVADNSLSRENSLTITKCNDINGSLNADYINEVTIKECGFKNNVTITNLTNSLYCEKVNQPTINEETGDKSYNKSNFLIKSSGCNVQLHSVYGNNLVGSFVNDLKAIQGEWSGYVSFNDKLEDEE